MAKFFTFALRNRALAIVLLIAALGVGAVFLTVGLALLAGLVLAGGVLGAGYAMYHRLRGSRPGLPRHTGHVARRSGLDPALEVKPTRPSIVAPRANDTEPVTKRSL
jgi:hypothetical protein